MIAGLHSSRKIRQIAAQQVKKCNPCILSSEGYYVYMKCIRVSFQVWLIFLVPFEMKYRIGLCWYWSISNNAQFSGIDSLKMNTKCEPTFVRETRTPCWVQYGVCWLLDPGSIHLDPASTAAALVRQPPLLKGYLSVTSTPLTLLHVNICLNLSIILLCFVEKQLMKSHPKPLLHAHLVPKNSARVQHNRLGI